MSAKLGGAHRSPLLEALPAEDGTSLRRAEGHRGFLSALRAIGFCFGAHRRGPAASSHATFGALGLASLAALGLVLKALVRKKHLFARSKNKLGATLRTLQDLVMVFHRAALPRPGKGRGNGRTLHHGPGNMGDPSRREPRQIPWACGHEAATETQTTLP